MLKVGSLFSGIGAFEKALTNLGIEYELEFFCEIDKFAPKSYSAIHGEPLSKNLGDITKVDIASLPYVDLITHGSPCQDFSLAGLGKGGDKGTETRSSLMWNTVAIVGQHKPKYVIWENVKGVLGKKHKHNYDKYLDEMEELGYSSYAKVLNAKDYGIPQNRERIFVVSIRKDIDKGYRFPEAEPLKIRLKDVLEQEVDEKYYLSDESLAKLKAHNPRHAEKGNGFKAKIMNEKDTEEQVCTTIQTIMHRSDSTYIEGSSRISEGDISKFTDKQGVSIDYRIRKLTPKECWRLMGFSDEDHDKAQAAGISNSQLYKQAGNSIVVKVLERIFENLFKEVE